MDEGQNPSINEGKLKALNVVTNVNGGNSNHVFSFRYDVDSFLLVATLFSDNQTQFFSFSIHTNAPGISTMLMYADSSHTKTAIAFHENGLIRKISNYSVGGFLIDEIRFAHNNGVIDSITEPEVYIPFGDGIHEVSHSYKYHEGNCIRYVNSIFRNSTLDDIDTITFSYENYMFREAVPDQIPYNFVISNHSAFSTLDILYLFSLVDLFAISPNQNLVERRNNTLYSYEFNGAGNVTKMLLTDSVRGYDFEYTLEYY